MKISIALATYNGEKYLQEQLESFLAQTRLPDELVISDDCSTDNTMNIIKSFAAKAPFEVKYWQNEKNLGYGANFNEALLQTTGDLVFLSDQDDVWFPEKIDEMTRLSIQHPECSVLMNDSELTDADLNSVGLTKRGQMRSIGSPNTSFVMGCCSVIKRDHLDLCLPVPEGCVHDDWLMVIADALQTKFIHEQVFQYYRRHEANESQALFNQTKTISRWDVWKRRYKEIFIEKDVKNAQTISKLEAYTRGLNAVINRAGPSQREKLNRHLKQKLDLLDLIHERNTIRNLPFFIRIKSVYNFLSQGRYHKVSGLKSALRDLFG